MLWEATVQISDPILDIIKTDESLEFISLKEAINLLARKTNSSTFGIATYLLNKKVHILLDSHARQNNYKIEATSSAIDQDHWCGENDCSFWLNYIAENGKHYPSFSIGDNSKYNAGCQESFWKREEFFDLECIRSLNLFSTGEWNTLFQKQQYIWDAHYLNILKNDVPDLMEIDSDIYLRESINLEDQLTYQEIKKYPLFFKNDVFTVQEAACLISNYDPYLVGNKSRKVIWLDENPRYVEAENFIYSALRGGLFEEIEDEFYVVRAEILKTFLSSKDIFIDGFNEKQSTTSNNENLVNNTKLKNTIASLELEVAIEKNTVQQLNQEIEQLKNQLRNKDDEIVELVASQPLQQDCLLSQIFDETATERYAPDLVLSIKLWESVYIDNPKNDSHSNKANTWITSNTGYEQSKPSATKLREITTPFISWSTHRDKNYKK
jgi:hypothetical protein